MLRRCKGCRCIDWLGCKLRVVSWVRGGLLRYARNDGARAGDILHDFIIEVLPLWVGFGDELDFCKARPGFDLLFAGYCVDHCFVSFEPDEVFAAVAGGEGGCDAIAVLPDAAREVGCYAGVKGAVPSIG